MRDLAIPSCFSSPLRVDLQTVRDTDAATRGPSTASRLYGHPQHTIATEDSNGSMRSYKGQH
jgi:hypothetical protein